MGKITPFSIGRRDMQKEGHWEPLDIETYRITKPTVICLGGNCTKTPRDANAMCKLAQNLVGLKDKTFQNEIATTGSVDFVGIDYGTNNENKDAISRLTTEERDLIAKNLLVSMCKDENGNILPNDQIIKNFNQVTFFSWCHGGTEGAYIFWSAFNQMKELGIDEDVAGKACNQMFGVSYSPDDVTSMPSLRIFSENDKMRYTGCTTEEVSATHMSNLFQEKYPKSPHNGIYKADDVTAVLITSHVVRPKTDENGKILRNIDGPIFKDEHDAFLINRDENWRPTAENISSYGDKVSQVAGYTLANSIANSIQNQDSDTFIPKPTIDEVISDARDILAETQKSAFYEIIKNIKEEHGMSTEDIPEELLQDPN